MSGKNRELGMDSLARTMDETVDGEQIDLQDVARSVNSGKVEAEEQQLPEDEVKRANTAEEAPDEKHS